MHLVYIFIKYYTRLSFPRHVVFTSMYFNYKLFFDGLEFFSLNSTPKRTRKKTPFLSPPFRWSEDKKEKSNILTEEWFKKMQKLYFEAQILLASASSDRSALFSLSPTCRDRTPRTTSRNITSFVHHAPL